MHAFKRLVGILAMAVVSASPVRAQVTVLRGATLIDGTDRAPIANAAVVVKNGWITAVGPSAEVRVPAGARVYFEVPVKERAPRYRVTIESWEWRETGGL